VGVGRLSSHRELAGRRPNLPDVEISDVKNSSSAKLQNVIPPTSEVLAPHHLPPESEESAVSIDRESITADRSSK
jgi:hypothetical protein